MSANSVIVTFNTTEDTPISLVDDSNLPSSNDSALKREKKLSACAAIVTITSPDNKTFRFAVADK